MTLLRVNFFQGKTKTKTKKIFLYGDSAQQLMGFAEYVPASMQDIIYHTKLKHENLVYNHRLPKSIARVARYLNSEDDITSRCINNGTEKPFVLRFKNIFEQFDYIQAAIKNRGLEDVAILFRTTAEVKEAKLYFQNSGLDVEVKMSENADELDFNSSNPKMMTYHSSKGLQFETVFLPNCNSVGSGNKAPLYVAMTRTYKSLYILHSGDLSNYFATIPEDLYVTQIKETDEL